MSAISSSSANKEPLDAAKFTREDKIEIAALLKKEGLISKETAQAYCRVGSEIFRKQCKKEPSAFRFTLAEALQHFPQGSLKATPIAKEKIAALLTGTTASKNTDQIPREDRLAMCALLLNHGLVYDRTIRKTYHVGTWTIQKYRQQARVAPRFTLEEALRHTPTEFLIKKASAEQQKVVEPPASAKAETAPPTPERAQEAPATIALPAAAPKEPEPALPSENFTHWVNLYRAEEVPLNTVLRRCGMDEAEFKVAAKRVPICDKKAVEQAIRVMLPERLAPAGNATNTAPLPPLPPAPQATALLPLPAIPPLTTLLPLPAILQTIFPQSAELPHGSNPHESTLQPMLPLTPFPPDLS